MSRSRVPVFIVAVVTVGMFAASAIAQPKPYRLPSVDLKQRVIWGSECVSPEGFGLAFGGQDQESDDGQPHTRILVDGKWVAIHEKLRASNPLQKQHDEIWAIRKELKDLAARVRARYFEWNNEKPPEDEDKRWNEIAGRIDILREALQRLDDRTSNPEAAMAIFFLPRPSALKTTLKKDPGTIDYLLSQVASCENAANEISSEPPPRANSALVYEPRTKRFVLFGGDHLDYLMNDTWTFDSATNRWEKQGVNLAPSPRANHTWKAPGDGTVILSGGYKYTSSTDYVGGQYVDREDGEWKYDVNGNAWSKGNREQMLRVEHRVYRTGPFDPAWYYAGEESPNREQIAKRLSKLPANKWVSMNPPRLPRLNRDWGTAILDPDRDLILRYSGGHSAHGGTDVLHYHLATNRWELTNPVEFPLGQLYTNTEYPDGFNFNMRPWITGHTYQSYGYDPLSRKMLFTGRPRHTYFYDPDRGDWSGRFTKPDSMTYDSCFYTLTLCTTSTSLYAWTQGGELLRFEPDPPAWRPVTLQGERLPGSVVDNSTFTFDSERNRLLFVRKEYGDKATFDGQIHAVDLASGAVSKLSPKNSEHASKIPYLCQLRYDEANDLALVGGTLPPDDKGIRRTPAYDCVTNAWIALNIAGDDPSGPKGRNVSLGMVYDPRRKLFWAVDTDSQVYVLRLVVSFAERQPLR